VSIHAESVTARGADLPTAERPRGETIVVAESSTGGLVSAALLAMPGASAYFLGGAIV
jgi:nicotinamide-nucleotide amidase